MDINGIYTLAEVSRLTELHPSRVRSWFKPRIKGAERKTIFHSDYEVVDHDFAVSFYDLIDVLVAGQLRDVYKVSMPTVRRAHTLLQKILTTKHPFSRSDIYTDGKKIFVYAANELGEQKLSDVISNQQFFVHIKEKLSHIDYSRATQLAERWRIADGILVDPIKSLGKPTIENTSITTFVIAKQFCANSKNASLVADLYDISETSVEKAVKFEERYGCLRAA